ncbi:MAG: ATP-binding protein [Polyangiaceae bacterium]
MSSTPDDEGRLVDLRSRVAATEAKLFDVERSLRTLVEHLPDGALVHDGSCALYANRALCAMLGVGDAGGIDGFQVAALACTEGGSVPVRRSIPRRDGSAMVGEVEAFGIDWNGTHASLVIARDVTERLRIEAQLLLADRMASMGTLAAGVAHEVNGPLGYTIANLGFALEELSALERGLVASDEESRSALTARLALARATVQRIVEALREARQGGDRVRHIVRDLKTFATADDSRTGPIDVRRVLESSINMAYNEIRHRARLVKDYFPTPLVRASEARLGQVFLNLLLNAAHAIGEGDVERHCIRIVARSDSKGRCVVEVSDTGRGISPDHQRRIFDPFFTISPGSGTGLGLSICQNIVATVGGDIAVESAVGKGSTFRVTLPAAGEEVSEPVERASPSVRAPAQRARILVIDDEPMMARAVQRLLESENDVVASSDPNAAVQQVRSGERFDVIVCDLMMPALSGMEVYEAICGIDIEQARRIVFMTGGAFTPRAVKFLESVDNVRIEKPLDRSALRAAIRSQMT